MTFNVILALAITLFRLFFKVIVYFLFLTDFLKDFAVAVNFGVAFLTVTVTDFVDFLYASVDSNVNVIVCFVGGKVPIDCLI